MLSRVAENLFWIGRYVERAENIARLIDAVRRMVALPTQSGRPSTNEWSSVLIAAGARDQLGKKIETATKEMAVEHLIFDPSNMSSISNCFIRARENARAVRTTLTQESWEALNTAWREVRDLSIQDTEGARLPDTLDWVKSKSAMFRGATNGTMMRADGYAFLRLGAAIERIDSTARLLDVKYHVLLRDFQDVGSIEDHYQWLSLLQAASAQRAYFFATQQDVSAKGVADFLILNPHFPRSIVFNLMLADSSVAELEAYYQIEPKCRQPLSALAKRVSALSIHSIIASGLHEFLTEIIESNVQMAQLLAASYGFAPDLKLETSFVSRQSQ